MKSYQNVLKKILAEGVEKESGRDNMPNTIGLSHAVIQMDLQDGFPLLTTKKMHWKGIVHELLWFLRGETNIKYLVDNGCNIWNADAYRWYVKQHQDYKVQGEPISMEKFIDRIKTTDNVKTVKCFGGFYSPIDYHLGDLGKVYGHQWRNQNGVDQVADVLYGLKNNPYSRYHIIDAWNKAEFKEMALPPCHLLYQFIVRPISIEERVDMYCKNDDEFHKLLGTTIYPENASYTSENNIFGEDCPEPIGIEYSQADTEFLDNNNIPKFYLDLNMYQRSCDTFLGVPYNLASMSCLLKLFAKLNNMKEGVATWIGGDTHLYVDHIPMAKELLSREPLKLPELKINKDLNTLNDILSLTIDDFELVNYKSYPAIKAELFVGLAKKS